MPETPDINYEESLLELAELAGNLDYEVKDSLLVKIRKPQAKFLVGTGKAEEIMELAKENKGRIPGGLISWSRERVVYA